MFLWRVRGPSMVPTLRSGELVLVSARPPHAGEVVVGHFRNGPTNAVVKRAIRRHEDGWWLASDNAFAGGDSATHGVATVVGVVVLVVSKRGRPRRVGAAPDV